MKQLSHSCPLWDERAWRNLKRFLGVLGIAAVIFILIAQFALAAWVATDDFESYSVGDLTGNNGGSGWSGAYTSCSVNYDVVSSPAQGTRAGAAVNPQDGNVCIRSLTTDTDSGIYAFELQIVTDTSWGPENTFFQFEDDAGTAGMNINVVGSNIVCNGGGIDQNIVAGFSTGVWYKIHVKYDVTGGSAAADSWQCRLDADTAWSADVDGISDLANIGRIRIFTNNNHTETLAFDNIGTGSEPAAAATTPQVPGIIEFNLNVPLPKQIHV